MKYKEEIKPISYLKTHASKIIKDINENGSSLIITRNGEAKVVMQDIKEYKKQQQKMALLKIIAFSEKQVKEGKTISLNDAFKELDIKIAKLKKEWNTK